MPRAKDPERAETEARLQQAIAEYKNDKNKRQIVDGKHILTTLEVHDSLVEWEKTVKKRKTTRTKKGKMLEYSDALGAFASPTSTSHALSQASAIPASVPHVNAQTSESDHKRPTGA
jgi:hypothetical protein